MKNKWYSFFKSVLLGPLLRVWNRPELMNGKNIPDEGAAIMVSNHQAVFDSFFFPLVCPRQLRFPAKSEYFTRPGLVGGFQKWFFTAVGQVPIDRNSKDAGDAITRVAAEILDEGELFGIYPEGTRSPDGRIYKGRTGVARIAIATGAPLIPVGMIGSRDANPIGSVFLRPKKVKIVIGEPLDPMKWLEDNGFGEGTERRAARALTDHLMHQLAHITGYGYVDVYAAEVKKSLEAGEGFPPGATEKDTVYY